MNNTAARSVLNDSKIETVLAALHAKNKHQSLVTAEYFRTRTGPWHGMEPRDHAHFADKLIALDRDKCELCYLLCRAINAKQVVEVGTSCGVSTLYLAAAVRDNGGGVVIGSEYEPIKVHAARENIAAAELAEFVDLREGDVLETFKDLSGPVDFVLFDIWTHIVRPTLDLVLPHLRTGSIVCADNTGGARNRAMYTPFFAVINDSAHGFRTLTLPFSGGFEVAVKV